MHYMKKTAFIDPQMKADVPLSLYFTIAKLSIKRGSLNVEFDHLPYAPVYQNPRRECDF